MANGKPFKIQTDLEVAGEILNKASTTREGVVQLNNSVSSTSVTQAATANAVKTAYDKANHSHPYVPTSNVNSISIHADSNYSSSGSHLLLKAGHNELKIVSSGGSQESKKLYYNSNEVYHAGNKPVASDIRFNDGATLQDKLNNGTLGGSSNNAYLPLIDPVNEYTVRLKKLNLNSIDGGYIGLGDLYLDNGVGYSTIGTIGDMLIEAESGRLDLWASRITMGNNVSIGEDSQKTSTLKIGTTQFKEVQSCIQMHTTKGTSEYVIEDIIAPTGTYTKTLTNNGVSIASMKMMIDGSVSFSGKNLNFNGTGAYFNSDMEIKSVKSYGNIHMAGGQIVFDNSQGYAVVQKDSKGNNVTLITMGGTASNNGNNRDNIYIANLPPSEEGMTQKLIIGNPKNTHTVLAGGKLYLDASAKVAGDLTIEGIVRFRNDSGKDYPAIKAYDDQSSQTGGNSYGMELVLCAGGNSYYCSGECGDTLRDELTKTGGSDYKFTPYAENLVLGSDAATYLYTNCQNFDSKKGIIFTSGGSFAPIDNGGCNLGGSVNRWNQVWCTQSSLNSTSDRRVKKDINEIKGYKSLIMGIDPVEYRLVDGESNRIHYGFISQQVKEAMTAADIDDCAFYLCDVKEEALAAGKTIETADEDEKVYGLRYGEIIAPMVKVIQDHENEIAELKKLVVATLNENKELKMIAEQIMLANN